MTPQSELEIKGNFFTHPFAELLVEIAQAGLNGSLRVAEQNTKCVIYFKRGKVVFAVSNARSTRLFDLLLRRNKLSKEDLVKIPNFSNDFELTKYLTDKQLINKDENDGLFKEQIEGILADILTWPGGEWAFSPLARIREGLYFEIDILAVLANYSRCLTSDFILSRFRTLDETFCRTGDSGISHDLTLEQGFVLSRIEESPLSTSSIISLCSMPDQNIFAALYTLWIRGLLIRDNGNPAFSGQIISAIKSAKLELRTEAKDRQLETPVADKSMGSTPDAKNGSISPTFGQEEVFPLNDYLERVENAQTFYDILGVEAKAESEELKRAYFFLAKNFHPDRFHSEGGPVLKRIQNAFTELAQAHETLKNAQTREIYDYRMRKEIAEREKRQASGQSGSTDLRLEQASINFDRGLELLMENENDGALPFLARAVHFAPQNARYHAYYGQALSSDESKRHKAEAELQAALKIEPDNPAFRIMLAELFIQFKLVKRAEGELNRLLALFPNNSEARRLLDSLKH